MPPARSNVGRATCSPMRARARSTGSRWNGRACSSLRWRSGCPTWTLWGSTSRRSRPRPTRPITTRRRTSASPPHARSTTTSPTSSPATPIASSGWARCRSRPRSWQSRSSIGCTDRWVCAASRSPPTSRAMICRAGTVSPKVFAKAEELGLTLFMHPTGFTEARRFADHYFTNVIGNPLDTTVAVHHLIFGGVLEQCPKLKLVLAHGGGYLPRLFRPYRPCGQCTAGLLRADPRDAYRIPEAAVFRLCWSSRIRNLNIWSGNMVPSVS